MTRTIKMYRVTRNCCTSGNCVTCTKKTPVGTPMRVTQQENVTKKRADELMAGWRIYSPAIEAMEPKKVETPTRSGITVIVKMGEGYRDRLEKALRELGATDVWGQHYEDGSTTWKVKCFISPTVAVQTELWRRFPGSEVEVQALTHFLCVGPMCWGRGTSEEAAIRKARSQNPGYSKFKVLALYECTEDCAVNGMGYVIGTAAEKIR